ncbi:MAG: hypothetical protein EBS19_07345 [Spirochaetia bacterium]|nr:hypothetical protein [Spirochaetia bacterium]
MPIIGNKIQGKFKKVLISNEELSKEALQIKKRINILEDCYLQKKISDWESVLIFILIYLNSRVKNFAIQEREVKKYQKIIENTDFLVNYNSTPIEILPNELIDLFVDGSKCNTIREYLICTRFLKLKEEIKICLLEWSVEKYSIILDKNPFSPNEMLRIQSLGKRVVTLSFDTAKKGELLGSRDAFEFALHDLSHAYTFFSPYYNTEGQIKFFQFLYRHFELLTPYYKDPEFQKKLIYLKSDMNSHPEHLKSYFRAILKDSKKILKIKKKIFTENILSY